MEDVTDVSHLNGKPGGWNGRWMGHGAMARGAYGMGVDGAGDDGQEKTFGVWYRVLCGTGGSGFTGKMDEGKNGGIRVHILRRTRTNGSLRVTEDLDDRFYLTAENFFQASSPGTFVDKFDLVI